MKMDITITICEKKDFRGYANVVFDGNYALEHVQFKGPTSDPKDMVVIFPEITKRDGSRKEIFHPTTSEAAAILASSLKKAYANAQKGQRESSFTNDLPEMQITGVRTAQYEKDYMIGLANIRFSDNFVLEGAQIKTGPYGEYVAMPTYRRAKLFEGRPVLDSETGKCTFEYRDVFKPINKETAHVLKDTVLNKFFEQHPEVCAGEELSKNSSPKL